MATTEAVKFKVRKLDVTDLTVDFVLNKECTTMFEVTHRESDNITATNCKTGYPLQIHRSQQHHYWALDRS